MDYISIFISPDRQQKETVIHDTRAHKRKAPIGERNEINNLGQLSVHQNHETKN